MSTYVSCSKHSADVDNLQNSKQDKLKTCSGADLPAGTKVPSCDDLTSALAGKQNTITGGTTGQVYTKLPDGSYGWTTISSGGSGTTELADGTTILGAGTGADRFRVANPLPTGGTAGQVPTKQADGTTAWQTPATGGSGTTELADGTTILGIGSSADKFRVANPLPSGGTAGQVATKQADGSVAWTTVTTGGSGTTELADGVTILGAGTSTDRFRVPAATDTTAGITTLAVAANYPSTSNAEAATPAYVALAMAQVKRGWYFRAQI